MRNRTSQSTSYALSALWVAILLTACGGTASKPPAPPAPNPGGLMVTTTSLPNATLSSPYRITLQATGGFPPYTWSLTSGLLPDGLILDNGIGDILGTPSKTGTFTFTVMVTESAQSPNTDTQSLDLTVIDSLPPGEAIITLDSSITFQTITGWEVLGWIAQKDNRFELDNVFRWRDEAADRAVNEVGITRVRLELRSGAENPVDYFTQYLNDQITRTEWSLHWYDLINDNSDAFVINPNGFQFSELDYDIQNVVLPLKTRLEANGEKLYINFNYVDFDPSTFEHYDNPDEYAEFILAAFQHMDTTYGFVPDAVEVILEPDIVSGWTPFQIGSALVAAGQRLEAAGYTPDFIAPSTSGMGNAVPYLDQMVSIPGFLQYMSELSYHRYFGVTQANLQQIASRGRQYGIGTSMLEWWSDGGNTFETLHEDLKVGENTAWQRQAIAGCCSTQLGSIALFMVDNTANFKVAMTHGTKYVRQYFKFIRPGAQRIEATSNNADFDPLAFINANGGYVVVVKAAQGGSFSIQNLPAGTYSIKYTTGSGNNPPSAFDVDLADITISAGQALTTNIPAAGVITVY